MSYSSNNRNSSYLAISFCVILLFINSCASIKSEKLSVSPAILKQYTGSYRMGPDSIARVTLEGNQLFVSSCPLIGLSISPSSIEQYLDSNQQGSDLKVMVTSEINMMTRTTADKKYPVYAKSEGIFTTKTRFPAQIEFFKNDKGEVTHFILKRKLNDLKILQNHNDEFLGVEGVGMKIKDKVGER